MGDTWKGRALPLTALLMVLAVLSVLVLRGMAGAREGPAATAVGSGTDSVRFSADLRAAEKDPELLGQYAWTSVNGQVVQSRYSTEPQPMETESFGLAGNSCAYGGAGAGCLGPDGVANATTVEGMMDDAEHSRSLFFLGLAVGRATVAESFTTGASCSLDENGRPTGEGRQPSGVINYGAAALLGGLPSDTIDLADINTGEPFHDEIDAGVLLNLLFSLYVEVDIESNWDWDEENLRAYSELTVSYLVRDSSQIRAQESFTARSECGMLMSDGRGSTAPAGIGVSAQAEPFASGRGLPKPEPESLPTSAPGAPRTEGFTTEDSLTVDGDGMRYHLLATRELGLVDRAEVTEVLAAIAEPGAGVEGGTDGARWQVFSAEAAGERVPVLEITLADGAVVQVRPALPGVLLPTPDVIESPAPEPTPTTESATTASPEPVAPEEPVEPAEPADPSGPAATTATTTGPGDD